MREEAPGLIEIDGSWGEGGGQILRVAVALSAVLCEPVRIRNIRVKRSRPGLRTQHLTTIRAVAELAKAEASGLKVGSREITFNPRRARAGKLVFDTRTAASTALILQGLIPAASFASGRVEVTLVGGTNNPWAPPIEFTQQVFIPTVNRMGLRVSVELRSRGFYPRGGGTVTFRSEPVEELRPIELVDFEGVEGVWGLSYSCRLPCHIVERMAKSAHKVITGRTGLGSQIATECLQSDSSKCSPDPGCGIILFAQLTPGGVLAGDSLGRIGKPAEEVGSEAAEALVRQIPTQAPVDIHLGDQLIPYMALARGRSSISVTQMTTHTITCIHVTEAITGVAFEVSGELGSPSLITCEGIGLRNDQLS